MPAKRSAGARSTLDRRARRARRRRRREGAERLGSPRAPRARRPTRSRTRSTSTARTRSRRGIEPVLDAARRRRKPGALDAAGEAHASFGPGAACAGLDVERQEELAFEDDALTIEHAAVPRGETHARRARGPPPREAVRESGERARRTIVSSSSPPTRASAATVANARSSRTRVAAFAISSAARRIAGERCPDGPRAR